VVFGGIEFSLIQLEPSEVDQHSGGIPATCDGMFEEGALIFPIKSPDPGPRAQKEEPNHNSRSKDEVRKPCNRQARGEKEKRCGEIDPVFGDSRIQRKEAADRQVSDSCEDQAARDRPVLP
jgi:hypothetical protein